MRVLFDKFGVKSVNLTHQSILALYAYNATSGIVVDIGERMDIVPVIDGGSLGGGSCGGRGRGRVESGERKMGSGGWGVEREELRVES